MRWSDLVGLFGTKSASVARDAKSSKDGSDGFRTAFGAAAKAILTIIGTITGVAALVFGAYQLDVQRQMQREATAYAIYNDFLTKSLEFPDFACVDTEQQLEAIKNTPDPTSLLGQPLFEKYVLYRQLMLSSMEQILETLPEHEDWVYSVRRRIKCHKPYLTSDHFTAERYKGWKCSLRAVMAQETNVKHLACSTADWKKEQAAHARTSILPWLRINH